MMPKAPPRAREPRRKAPEHPEVKVREPLEARVPERQVAEPERRRVAVVVASAMQGRLRPRPEPRT